MCRPINNKMSLLLLIIILGSVVIYFNWSSNERPFCNNSDNGPKSASLWDITAQDIDAHIVWQLSESREPANNFSGAPNSGVTASEHHLIYLRYPDPQCDESPELIAFDLASGDEQWRFDDAPPTNFPYPSYTSVFRWIESADDGYVFISADHMVFKLDLNGNLIWHNDEFPSRSIQTLRKIGTKIYLPSYSRVYELSSSTGQITQVFDVENVVGFFDEFAVTFAEGSTLDIVNTETREEEAKIQLSNRAVVQQALLNLLPIAERHGDILLLYNHAYSPTGTDAYQIKTGELLWTLNRQMYTLPILVDDRLVVYGPDGLTMYDPETGLLLGHIKLERNEARDTELGPLTHVWLAGYGSTIIINYRDTWEIVAIKLSA